MRGLPASLKQKYGSLAPVVSEGERSVLKLEVHAQRELNLAAGAKTDRSANRRVQYAEVACRRSREGLAGLNLIRACAERVRQRRRWVGEVRVIEDIEELRFEFDVRRFRNSESLVHHQVGLPEIRPVQRIAHEVAERSGLRDGKCRRVEELAIIVEERIDAGDQIGPAHVARRAASGGVDNESASCSAYDARGRDAYNIRASHANINRQSASGVDDRADLPAAENCVSHSAQVVQITAAPAYRQRINRT